MSCRQCPPHGRFYCEDCADKAARVGIIVPREPTLVQRRHALTLAPDVPEGELQGRLQSLCKKLGYPFFHVLGKAAKTSTAGLPDALILDPGDAQEGIGTTGQGIARFFAWELKSEGQQPSPAQRRWLEGLARVQRIETGTYYPRDWENMVELLRRKRSL